MLTTATNSTLGAWARASSSCGQHGRHLAAAQGAVRGDHRLGGGVPQPGGDGGGGEAGKQRNHHRPDAGYRIGGDHGLRRHGQEDRHGVALADATLAQARPGPGHLPVQFGIRQLADATGLVLVHDGHRIGGLGGPAAQADVGDVEPAAGEPFREGRPAGQVHRPVVRLGEADAEVRDDLVPEGSDVLDGAGPQLVGGADFEGAHQACDVRVLEVVLRGVPDVGHFQLLGMPRMRSATMLRWM